MGVQGIHQNTFCEDFLTEDDFEAVLAMFCNYDYGVNASETVEKMAIDQKNYRKCSLCVIVCCIATACHQYNSKNGWLLGHLRRS